MKMSTIRRLCDFLNADIGDVILNVRCRRQNVHVIHYKTSHRKNKYIFEWTEMKINGDLMNLKRSPLFKNQNQTEGQRQKKEKNL